MCMSVGSGRGWDGSLWKIGNTRDRVGLCLWLDIEFRREGFVMS